MRTIAAALALTLSACGPMPVDAPEDTTGSTQAPDWAQRQLFGHASPRLLLINVDGGAINGAELVGKKRVMVFFDWASQADQRDGAIALKVLQQAQAPLSANGIEIMLAQIQHPSQRARPPMNDTDLRQFCADNQATPSEGGPLPCPPLYRSPNKTEDNPSRALGLEGSLSYLANLGEAPNIFLLDEEGVIRWHSAGPIPGRRGEPDMVAVIVAAVTFAETNL